MNTPSPSPEPYAGIDGPAQGDERCCLELVLRIQPFPCLVVENETARTVLWNDEARRMLVDVPRGSRGGDGCYATDRSGGRIEPDQVIPYLLGRDAAGDGVELAWHAPGDRRFYRVASRRLPPKDGMGALSMLTFLELTGQKLAEGELRDAVAARDEFFSVTTHELKDPLFSLQLSIQLLRREAEHHGPIPDHVRHHLEVSERQVSRLGRLIDNMLDFARINSGRFELDLETLNLSELAHQVVARFQGQASSSGTALSAESSHPVVGRFDRLKLEQILGNLLSNAIKYGGGRPVVVRVRDEQEWAVIEVEDAGTGIAAEDQERIFQRFERASAGHKRASLGLGLYIVRSLVEAHGGSIALRSQAGRGSTFSVMIPCVQTAERIESPATS